ncbi:hypothetical protein LZZ85_03925 [Terrimonas sp. NA20]|uniref:Uncharacterized protein n=1 Tax=Terrimonas ginsenosidimutans TaxID=2908004 RepID=A0ABS9KM99_9BACT|nr:hypothetical protein [Terrimonas ginsenosidimutans]MCG2613410.1 hypothetical protein [Terrimonas ginsenosidimutans]
MQNTTKPDSLQAMISDTLSKIADSSLQSFRPVMDGMLNNMSSISQSVKNINPASIKLPKLTSDNCNCCPPEPKCPPHCIAQITRIAAQDERILIPFMVKNSCSKIKTYRVGVRELKDQDGNMAPFQPQLSKQTVTVEPGRSERVVMMIELGQFANGATYTTEIVLREKEINQNICFTLKIDNDHHLVTAQPQDEKQYQLRWQSWQSHFYCEPKKDVRANQ